jgi:putative spermidine/putrescine transport system permease protein
MARSLRGALAVVVALLCGFPFVYLALLSVAGSSSLRLDRWSLLLAGQGGLAGSLALSCLVSTIVAALATPCGFVTARHIAYHPWRRQLLLLAYVPFALSPVILGACLLYLWLRIGLAGSVAGVILAQTIFAYGFAIVFFVDLWTPEKKALEELVATLGGGTLDLYRRVLLPLSRDLLRLCFFQTFLLSWFQYGLTLLVGSGKVKTLPIKVYDFLGEASPAYAAVAGCLLVVPPALLLWLNKRFLFKAV